MERIEIVRNINEDAEKILENFVEILNYLKSGPTTESEELQNLLFGKIRAAEVCDKVQRIYEHLTILQYRLMEIKRPKLSKKYAENPILGLFDRLNKEANI